MLALKTASLARGHSGVREAVLDTLLALHDAGLVPFIPSQGSVGASGDLAPLAHLTLALIGEGEMLHRRRALPASTRWRDAGIEPLALAAKEGLALINGTQVRRRSPCTRCCVRAGARVGARDRRDDRRRRARQRRPVRPAHPRAARTARPDRRRAYYRALLAGSEIRHSHLTGDDRVQDPYSLRCQPQVVGACLDQLRHAAHVLLREANGVTDNPLVFADDGRARLGRQLPRRAGRACLPTRWRSRSRRSARSPSGGSRC